MCAFFIVNARVIAVSAGLIEAQEYRIALQLDIGNGTATLVKHQMPVLQINRIPVWLY